MNKTELVNLLASRTQMTKKNCNNLLDEFKTAILEVCSKGGNVNIRNFGKFSLQERKARKYLNPQTKRYYVCKAKKLVDFKGYNNFKYAIS